MATNNGRALRIGIIHAGKIIEERLLRERTAVTVGSAPGNTFVVEGAGVGERTPLFDVGRDRSYVLCLSENMDARLAATAAGRLTDTFSVVDVRRAARRIILADGTHGRVQLGDVTVLFQFVAAPPTPRVAVELALGRDPLQSADPFFSGLIAASLLLHFGTAAWLSTVPAPPLPSLESVGDAVLRLAPRPFASLHIPSTTAPPPVASVAARDGAEKRQPAGDARATTKTAGLLRLLSARGPGGALGALMRSEGPTEHLGELLAGAHRVTTAADAVAGPRGSLPADAVATEPPSVRGGGEAAADVGPRGAVSVVAQLELQDPVDVVGSLDPRTISRMVRARMAGFKACYEHALKRAPGLQGKVTVAFTIDEDGRIADASVETDTLGDSEVAHCVVAAFRRIRFPSPDDGRVSASFPFVFVNADRERR